jgi:PAS domain S-box-containing protein
VSHLAKTARAFSVPGVENSVRLIASPSAYSAYLHALIENSPVATVLLDAQHRFLMCNPAFERLFQYSRIELQSTNLDLLIASPELVKEAASVTERVLSGENVHIVTRRRRRDGTAIDVEVHGVPLLVDGKLEGVYGLYQDLTERNRAESALRKLSGRFMQLQDEERRRVARDLHDTTAQGLAALNLNLRRLEKIIGESNPSVRKIVSDTIELASQCAKEIRSASYLLHPPLLEEIGLRPAIQTFAEGFEQRSGIRVDLSLAKRVPRLSLEAEAALFRVVQEALANVLRHSGSSVVKIDLKVAGDELVLTVADRGRGIRRAPDNMVSMGVGIRGMRERIEQLGGRLEVISNARGTRIIATVPKGA